MKFFIVLSLLELKMSISGTLRNTPPLLSDGGAPAPGNLAA
jgi:hypothetical protein